MSVTPERPSFLQGFQPRKEFAAELGICERTAKRWEDAGLIIVRKIGNQRLIDIERSRARLGGELPKRRRRGEAA